MFTDENSEDQGEVTACVHSTRSTPASMIPWWWGWELTPLLTTLPTLEHEQEGLGQVWGQLWEEMSDTERNTCKLKDPQNLEGEEHSKPWI